MSDDRQYQDDEGDLALAPSKPELQPPPRYKVIMHNDDFTPMDFVVEVLQVFFYMNEDQAAQTMMQVHNQGSAVCGIFTRDLAETKTALVNACAQENDYPLKCSVEKE